MHLRLECLWKSDSVMLCRMVAYTGRFSTAGGITKVLFSGLPSRVASRSVRDNRRVKMSPAVHCFGWGAVSRRRAVVRERAGHVPTGVASLDALYLLWRTLRKRLAWCASSTAAVAPLAASSYGATPGCLPTVRCTAIACTVLRGRARPCLQACRWVRCGLASNRHCRRLRLRESNQ